jgi:hypothetical protein
MSNETRFAMKKHVWRIAIYTCLICAPALLLTDPYMRQSLFGPKIHGVPTCAWEHDMRRRFSSNRNKPTFSEKMYATVGIYKSDYYIDGFSALPRRDPEMLPILLRLSNDDDEQVRWAVAHYLGYLRDREEALAILRIMVNDPANQVRERAKTSLEGPKVTGATAPPPQERPTDDDDV